MKFSSVAVLIFGIAAIIIVQFFSPTLFGADGYLHIRMAQFISDYGLKYDFHWARLSTFAHNFCDKDLLYHILLIPFVKLSSDIFFGAKLSAIFFGIVFLVIFFLMLRRYSPKALVPLFLLALLISHRFFILFLWPRQMIMVIALTILGVHFLIEEKYWRAFIITFIYCLSHVSGPYMLIYALITEFARLINKKDFNLKAIGIVALGIAASYLIHPNFPNNILVFYLNAIMVPLFSVKWGLELGAEFFPISTREYLLGYPFLFLAIIAMLFTGVFLRPKTSLRTQAFLLISFFFLALSFLSQRYIAQGYPVILLTAASYLKDYSDNKEPIGVNLKPFLLLFLGAALFFGVYTYKDLRYQAMVDKVYDSHYVAVAEFLKTKIPKLELIFHTNWSDSQYFIGVNPENDYFVTFDPIYMYYYDRKLYNLYRDVSFGRNKDPYDILKNTFKVNYGYAGKNYFGGLIEQIRKDSRFQVLGEDNFGLVFQLK